MGYIYDGTRCLGFILKRGKLGFEAIDREEASLGIFKTQTAAANAIFSHEKSPAAKNGANIEGSHEASKTAASSAQ
jgi:hypothetical protein